MTMAITMAKASSKPRLRGSSDGAAERIQELGKQGIIPQDFLEHDREIGEKYRQNFRKVVQAGVKLVSTVENLCVAGEPNDSRCRDSSRRY
jgi:imidazolonepropionase-like amidohydrolase